MSGQTMKLYETVDALRTVEEWLIESGGELTPAIEELLGTAGDDFKQKVENVALKIRELLAAAAIVKEEKDRLAARQKSFETAAEGLKRYLQGQLERAGHENVQGKLVTVAVQKNPMAVDVSKDANLEALWLADAPGVVVVPPSFSVDKARLIDLAKGASAAAIAALEAEKGGAKQVTDDEREKVAAAAIAKALPKGFAVTRGSSLRIR